MSFETTNIQVKSGSGSVKVRDLLGWDAANKASPLGARIMVVWLEHKKPDNIWGLRLPSFSGHPICTDPVSVGEDVHCESTAQEVHAGVPA